jgi:hypothetical protein
MPRVSLAKAFNVIGYLVPGDRGRIRGGQAAAEQVKSLRKSSNRCTARGRAIASKRIRSFVGVSPVYLLISASIRIVTSGSDSSAARAAAVIDLPVPAGPVSSSRRRLAKVRLLGRQRRGLCRGGVGRRHSGAGHDRPRGRDAGVSR